MRTKSQYISSLLQIFQVLLLGVCAAEFVLAQPREAKDLELSLSGGIHNVPSYNGFRNPNNFFLSSRLGYEVVSGLKLEPELMSVVNSGLHPVYMFNGNVSYNFNTKTRSNPFVLIGYGRASKFPLMKYSLMEKDFAVDVLNVGVGVKIFLEKGPAFRIEYRYQKFSLPDTGIEARIYTVQFGFIILL